jgi:preprotein translocase subunit SecA
MSCHTGISASSCISETVRKIILACIDRRWSEYLEEIADLRDGIHLRRIGGQDPLFEFRKCSIGMFKKLESVIKAGIEDIIISVSDGNALPSEVKNKIPTTTWTYLINDDPFRDKFEMQFVGNTGFTFWAALLWTLTLLSLLINRKIKKKTGI